MTKEPYGQQQAGGQAAGATRRRLQIRARALAAIRGYFTAREYVEVDTPALQVAGGMEVHMRPFRTRLLADFDKAGDGGRPMELHTSPEFAMKRLLAAGSGHIFQVCHAFRNGERGRLHHPEFTMLEWYRVDADYTQAIAETCGLVAEVAGALAADRLRHGEGGCDPARPPEHLSVAEALARHAGMEVAGFADGLSGFADLARDAGVYVGASDTAEDVFHRVMMERVEPALGQGALTVLSDYPAELAALSRRKPGAPHLAERFEVYACGVELANGYSELTDGAEQRTRFAAARAQHRLLYGEDMPEDTAFLDAVAAGLPPCAGVALGVDRLLMMATGTDRIENILTVPV